MMYLTRVSTYLRHVAWFCREWPWPCGIMKFLVQFFYTHHHIPFLHGFPQLLHSICGGRSEVQTVSKKKLHIYTVLCGGASYKALFWQHINQDYLGRHEQPLSFFHWWLGQHLWWWQCIDLTGGTLALPAFLYTISDMTKKSCTQYYEHCNTTLLPNWMLCFLTDCIKTIWLYLNKSLI